MNISKIRVLSIKYTSKYKKVTCTIQWLNKVTNCVQKSKGVAKCNPDDTFDLVKGQRIAESRAKSNMWFRYEVILFNEYQKAMSKLNKLIDKESNHLKDLIIR